MLHALLLIAAVQADTQKIQFTGDAGLVSTSGNTTVTSINVGEKLAWKAGAWKFGQSFGVIYGRTDGVTSTELWRGSLRADRSVFARAALFVLAEGDRNTFAGIRSRFVQSVGVSLTLVDTAANKLVVDIGAGYTWQRNIAPAPDRDFAVGRASARYSHKFGEKSVFDQFVEYLPSFEVGDDYHLNSETSITAPITRSVAIKAGYTIRHAGLPEPGFKATDRILTTGVQVTF